jgi:predicted GH43/DUF377 family glycosyl hydrolase
MRTRRSIGFVFGPQAVYERSGDVPDYGAADSVVCLAEASLTDLLAHLRDHPCRDDGAIPLPSRSAR